MKKAVGVIQIVVAIGAFCYAAYILLG